MTGEVESKRVVIATIGSLGDLHPCLALALGLGRRGHRVTIASTEYYRDKVEELGIGFHSIRPNWNPTDRELISKCEDLKSGPEILYRKLILPELKGTYDDLLSVAASADLMIAGELVYAAPLVAEKLRLRWVSAILSPFSFFSSHDPSVMVTVPGLMRLRKAGWPVYRAGLNVCRLATRHWSNPVRHLRRELGLRPDCDPVFRDKFSPDLVLALFSHYLARPQPDWPPQTLQPGFVYFDRQRADAEPCAELEAFLRAGDPPVVFTLGSTAVHKPGNFYEASVEATKQLGCRGAAGHKLGFGTQRPAVSGVALRTIFGDLSSCGSDCASRRVRHNRPGAEVRAAHVDCSVRMGPAGQRRASPADGYRTLLAAKCLFSPSGGGRVEAVAGRFKFRYSCDGDRGEAAGKRWIDFGLRCDSIGFASMKAPEIVTAWPRRPEPAARESRHHAHVLRSTIEHYPGRSVVARVFLTAHQSVYTPMHEPIARGGREKEMVQPHPLV